MQNKKISIDCLIKDLLVTYSVNAELNKKNVKHFIYNGFDYLIPESSYLIVCKIIDFIKGVNHE